MKLIRLKDIFLFIVVFLGMSQIAFAQCTTTLSPGANIASAVSSAAAGSTICLNGGSYGSANIANITKTSMVTVKSVSSKEANVGSLQIGNSRYIRFDDVTIEGAVINACSQNVQITNSTFKNRGLTITNDGCSTNLNILVDGCSFNNLPTATYEGRVSMAYGGGITFSNNTLTGSGTGSCSDGVQLVGGVANVTIGPGNVFKDIKQGSCSAHVDAIQAYGGGTKTVITGNYFVNNTVNIGFYDGGSPNTTVSNNVFDTPATDSGQALQIGGIRGMLMEHNTFYNTTLGIGTKSGMSQHSGWIVQNNIFDHSYFTASGDQPGCGSDCIMRYNLKSNGGTTTPTGTNNITGNAIYGGAKSVTNWAAWQLAAGSPGKNSGNDGLDIGTTYYGSDNPNPTPTNPPSAPNNLRVVQ